MNPNLPESLALEADRKWQEFGKSAGNETVRYIESTLEKKALLSVFAFSDYVAKACIRAPSLLLELTKSGDLHRKYSAHHYHNALENQLETVSDESELGRVLCRFRRREMVRIAWRDLTGSADLSEILHDLSGFADASLDKSLGKLYKWHCDPFGVPMSADGNPQQLVVIGMGKLGAGELNFSSDVDLLFAYPEAGQTAGNDNPITNEEFFIRLCRRYVKILGTTTSDGPLFRVDLRLRPWGENGPLVMSFDNMEDYYQRQGRNWERYACD